MSAALSTAHDVYEALGIRRHDPASLRQHFYRTTECGAWAEIVEETVPAERKRGTWTAHLSRGVGARYWTLERIDYGSKSSVKPEVYLMAPPEVRDFIKIEVQELNERATTGSLGVGLDGERMSASYDLTWTETKVEKFFRIGCVVEGSDKEVGPYTIHLPTTLGAIEETVELVESEAEVMWQEIRGGDAVKCAMNFAREKLASVFEQFELGEENQSEHIDEIDDGYWIHASVYVPKMVDVGSVEDLVLRAEAVFRSGDLDDEVIDIATSEASSINNQGTAAQAKRLMEVNGTGWFKGMVENREKKAWKEKES